MQGNNQNGFRLGDFRVYPLRNILVGPTGEIHIEPKVMQVLERLASNAGEVVEREHLLAELWGGRAQSDEPLTRCIATLRRVLDDSPKDPEYIQTIPKRGYRLVCAVAPLEAGTGEAIDSSSSGASRRWTFVAIAAALILAVGAYVAYQFAPGESTEPQVTVEGAPPSEPPIRSIAVLPFANLSPEAENEYLSDGLAAELTNLLTTIPDLKVAARTSAFAFKGRHSDVTDIAGQLRVAHILSGSVRQSGERLRISVQLVDAKDGYHVWSNSWERELTDIFDIQDEIAAAVIDTLQLQLLQDMPAIQRTDPEAYAFYLKGQSAFREDKEPDIGEREPERHTRALSLTMHALAIDPDYAPAWAQLAGIQFNQAQWMTGDAPWDTSDRAEAYARAEASAKRALELDPNQTAALSTLGSVSDGWHWDAEAAAKWYKRAWTATPGSSSTLNAISLLYGRLGRPNIAHQYLQAALDRDPLNRTPLINLALSYWTIGDFDAARAQLERARQVAPHAVRIQVFEALFAYREGKFEQATQLSDQLNPMIYACSLYKMERVEESLAELEKLRSADPPAAFAIATVYACQNDKDSAFAWLQRAYEDHDPALRWMRNDANLENLHDDPRWEELLQKVGVSDDHANKVSAELGDIGL